MAAAATLLLLYGCASGFKRNEPGASLGQIAVGSKGQLAAQTHELLDWPVGVALVSEFQQIRVRDGHGHFYALTRKTQGVDLASQHEGQ